MEPQPGKADQVIGSEQRAKAQEFKNTGNDKFNKSNYKGAIVDYQKGLLHDPTNSDLQANLSAAYLHLEKYVEAEEHALVAMHLRPNFYKGYVRAAKAEHGKGMTKLALKRIALGLANVTDTNGINELTRLKNQYTAYMALQSNSERELEFDSDTYQSEDDEDEGLSTDDDSGDDQPNPYNVRPPLENPAVPLPPVPSAQSPVPDEQCDSNKEEPTEPIKSEPPKLDPIVKEPTVKEDKEEDKTEDKETEKSEKNVESEETACQQTELQEQKDTSNDTTPEIKHEHPLDRITELDQTSETSKNIAEQKDTSNDTTPEIKHEHPLDRIRELARTSEMSKNISDFKENLKIGGQAYLSGNYRKAAENYKTAFERVGKRYLDFETDERHCNVIRYASYAALIKLSTYDDIVKAIQGLNEMTKFAFDFPAIYIQIARAYYKLNRFKTALEPLEKLQEIIDNCPIYPTFIWPGTDEIIEETKPAQLKNFIKELGQQCRMPHKPTAVCRFDSCLKTSSHILPSEFIFTNDPDFNGFVRMICEEKCHIEFHISCWKSYKELVCGVGKINDKDFLGRCCLTTDCVNGEGKPSIITTIEIIDSDGQVKSVNKLDPKANSEQKAAEKKAKKKKSRLDDKENKENKEKVTKPKKTKENKVKTKKKKQTQVIHEDPTVEEEEEFPRVKTCVDPVKTMQNRKECLSKLRAEKFGHDEKTCWDPRLSYYGCCIETIKVTKNQFLDEITDSVEVADAKEFLFSYFVSILKDEGPLKLTEIEDLWKETAGDFCDITVVLPKLTDMCDLLMESTRFCQIEDRLCLAEQLEETYEMVRDEVVDTVTFLMTGTSNSETDSQQTDSIRDHEDAASSSGEESELYSDSDTSEDEESENEDKDEAEEEINVIFRLNIHMPPPLNIDPPKPVDNEKLSFDEMMKALTSITNIFEKGSEKSVSSTVTSENDFGKDQTEESVSNETFETARGSSANTTAEDTKTSNATDSRCSESSIDDHRENISSDQIDSEDTVVPNSADQSDDHSSFIAVAEETVKSEMQNFNFQSSLQRKLEHDGASEVPVAVGTPECHKGSQSEIVTEERHIQTSPLETKDRLSQTKESDLYKELNKKIQELTGQLSVTNKENARLSKEIFSEKQIQKAQHNAISRLQDENRRSMETQKILQEQMQTEISKREKEFKKKEDELTQNMNSMKEMYTNLLKDNADLKREMNILLKDTGDVKESLTAALSNIKEFELNYKVLENNMKDRLQKALKAELNLIKACWETQLNVHKKRYVDKITEVTSWFHNTSAREVELLPSFPLVQQNTMQWVKMTEQIQQIESTFRKQYKEIESKIEQGDDIEDLKPEILPVMPEEPPLPPLDKIHKEIIEKHLKTISELTQLVASQQLQIKKSEEKVDHLTQLLMNYGGNQMASPRIQQPMTTAFGSLASQYPFTANLNQQFPVSAVPSVPLQSQETAKMGNPSNFTDVQALLQETTKLFSTPPPNTNLPPPGMNNEMVSKVLPPDQAISLPPPVVLPIHTIPLPTMPPPLSTVGPVLSKPPPPLVGVAQNLSKNSSVLTEQTKETRPREHRAGTPKLEQKAGSRESTPGPLPAPVVPTPEKTKKKKKTWGTKSGEAAAAEARIAAAITLETPSPAGDETTRDDSSGWNIVLPKNAIPKQISQSSTPTSEQKLKNKKKLLDKLQIKFPQVPLKDLDDMVKQVRENNNGSLSGLPFDEIETRVGRVIIHRQHQKNTTMGLVKFTDAAWGTVKPQEIISWSNLQLEECTICLEPMRNDRTKVDCNHEFHTKCLRKWLKEKSVCPLCNKFTTMPDEFPAL